MNNTELSNEKLQELMDLEENNASSRSYIGFIVKIITVLAIVWTIFQIYMSSIGVMDAIKFRRTSVPSETNGVDSQIFLCRFRRIEVSRFTF